MDPITFLSQDEILSKVIQEVGPLDWSVIIKQPFVALIGVIVGQKISYKQARNIRSKIYSLLGTEFSPAEISAISDQELLSTGMSTSNLQCIRDVTHELLECESIGKDEILSLQRIKGIGPWTINSTLITSMLDYNLFPTNDVFINKRMQKLFGTSKDVATLSLRWSPYRSIACWYLWRWF